MRGPHVRFCERCRGVILCTYSTQDLPPSHTRPPRSTAGNSSAGCLKTGPQYTEMSRRSPATTEAVNLGRNAVDGGSAGHKTQEVCEGILVDKTVVPRQERRSQHHDVQSPPARRTLKISRRPAGSKTGDLEGDRSFAISSVVCKQNSLPSIDPAPALPEILRPWPQAACREPRPKVETDIWVVLRGEFIDHER
jgi:hypothetical protein